MNFIKILLRNLRQGPATDPFPFGEAFTPKGLRARVRFDAAHCSGCRMCEHVCAAGAIRFDESADGLQFTLWHDSCTFCGLCEHYCATKAIRLTEDWHLAHEQKDKYRMIESGTVAYAACADCGTRFIPMNPALRKLVYADHGQAVERLAALCPDCRRKQSATRLNR
ncbi:4Fe-4S ferredoxin [Stutzerimonas stutzeri]|uniref:4Fe-4S dicluster domain-containing protein n=1 Tax=Stutzerimonas stutzeri TaxID=316 RepID=UPI0024A36EC5|nr:4Fe-4S dicluster domain-containing protein [Stutzerimonas stutzeri]GLZ24123.1 4Fe-4S ferredoxin [Stutzerimonas stutzeri]